MAPATPDPTAGRDLRVLLIDLRSSRAEALRAALEGAGCEVFAWRDTQEDLQGFMARVKPEAVVIDVDSPSRDTLEHVALLGRNTDSPMITLTPAHDTEALRDAAEAGVCLYAVDSLSAPLARSLLNVSIAQFRHAQGLREELTKTRQQLEDRKLVDRAKALLMQHAQLDEPEAYAQLRGKAMRERVTMAEVSRRVIAVAEAAVA